MEFDVFVQNWNSVKDNLEETYNEFLNDDMIIRGTQESLEDGVRPDGVEMRKYTNKTISIKLETGGYISNSFRIALKDTGSFFNSMYVDRKGKLSLVNSTDTKTNLLVDQYTDKIFDTPGDKIQPIINEARGDFMEWLKKRTGL